MKVYTEPIETTKVYVTKGTRYDGAYDVAGLHVREDGWIEMRLILPGLPGTWTEATMIVGGEQMFATEADARAAAKAQREANRTQREQRVIPNTDWNQLVAYLGRGRKS